jgi:CDP-6-deoxy-D-xylo-4-hexulose-3-dehydrase
MIMVNNAKWRDRLKVLRGWGRTSSLFAESESLSKRFKMKLDNIPYDAKFIFDEIAYNFLPTEIGAAFGNAQLDKLNKFKKTREDNFKKLHKFFEEYEDIFVLPHQDEKVATQWLAFPLTIRKNAPFTRLQLTTYLEKNNIQTRPIFTGNILKQPGFKMIPHKIIRGGDQVTNDIMVGGFVIGCHHGMTKEHIDRLKEVFTEFLKKY